jgi:hypothetical protein
LIEKKRNVHQGMIVHDALSQASLGLALKGLTSPIVNPSSSCSSSSSSSSSSTPTPNLAIRFAEGDFKSSSNDAVAAGSWVVDCVLGALKNDANVVAAVEELEPNVGPPKEDDPNVMTYFVYIRSVLIDVNLLPTKENECNTVLALEAGDSW